MNTAAFFLSAYHFVERKGATVKFILLKIKFIGKTRQFYSLHSRNSNFGS